MHYLRFTSLSADSFELGKQGGERMSIRYILRRDKIVVELTEAITYGIDAVDECGKLLRSVVDVSLNCEAVKQLVENLNNYKVELVHLMDVVYDFYYDHC